MIRRIIQIDQDKCNGCGLCAKACHENAIGIVNGKAKLLRDDYCDGLGDCLPACPVDAFRKHDIQSITVIRMEVPCCGGLEFAASKALKASKKKIPWQVVTVSTKGQILSVKIE